MSEWLRHIEEYLRKSSKADIDDLMQRQLREHVTAWSAHVHKVGHCVTCHTTAVCHMSHHCSVSRDISSPSPPLPQIFTQLGRAADFKTSGSKVQEVEVEVSGLLQALAHDPMISFVMPLVGGVGGVGGWEGVW